MIGPRGGGSGPERTPVPEGPYALWDEPTPSTPPRSRLYSLEPIGIGTSFVESLTGYLSRLAEAHQVHPSMLVARMCAPEVGYASFNIPGNCGLSTVWNSARAMNGLQKVARDWVRVLERLTGRQDLRFLTWLPWAEVLDHKHLIRMMRAWCPACYADWRSEGTVVYEPLLWAAASVQYCPRHQMRLVDRCPSAACRLTGQLWLSARLRPGHCARCGRWLGHVTGPDLGGPHQRSDEPRQQDLWRAKVVGELLAIRPGADAVPGRDGLRDVLNEAVRRRTQGNVDSFARMLRLHPETLRQWCQGSALQLDSVLELASRLGVTPRQLLTGDRNAVHERLETDTARDAGEYDRLKPPRLKFDAERVRSALEATLASDEDPPPSLRKVAQRLGIVEAGGLYRRFPELSRAVAARFQAARKNRTLRRQDALREEVRQVVAVLNAEGQYPSCNLVRARLSHPAALRNTLVREEWEASLREYGWEKGTQGRRPLGPSGRGQASRGGRQLDSTLPTPGGR